MISFQTLPPLYPKIDFHHYNVKNSSQYRDTVVWTSSQSPHDRFPHIERLQKGHFGYVNIKLVKDTQKVTDMLIFNYIC